MYLRYTLKGTLSARRVQSMPTKPRKQYPISSSTKGKMGPYMYTVLFHLVSLIVLSTSFRQFDRYLTLRS